MIGLIVAAALAADPGRNDLKAPVQGPDSVHVGICTGSDIKGQEIMLLDRLCMNRQSVVVATAAIDDLQRERNGLIKQLNETNKKLAESQSKEGLNPVLVTVIALGAAAVAATAVGVGLKAAGKI